MSSEPNAESSESHRPVGTLSPKRRASPQPASAQPASPQRRCRYFRSGNCSYGSNCKFLHIPSPTTPGRATTVSAAEEKPVCRYFQKGWCRYGARCNNAHQRSSKKRAPAADAEAAVASEASDGSRLDSQTPRETEIAQFKERYPMHAIDGEWLVFTFCPSDPYWLYAVRELQLAVCFPEQYPAEPFAIRLGTNERVPEMVCRLLGRHIAELAADIQSRRGPSGNVSDPLPFRLFLSELDKQMEDFFTASLKLYKRDMDAKAAGIQFVPFYELRGAQANKHLGPRQVPALPGGQQPVPGQGQQSEYSTTASSNSETRTAEDAANHSEAGTASDAERDRSQSTSAASSDLEESDDQESDDAADDEGDQAAAGTAMVTKPQGTEVRMCGLQLVGAAATLVCTRLGLVVSCGRCRHCELMPVTAGAAASSECSRCHEQQTVTYESAMVHSHSSALGYLRVAGCVPFDVALVSCSLTIGCLNCGKDNVLKGMHPGAVNTHWCLHCHQKMEISVEKCSFIVHGLAAAGTHIDKKNVEKVQRSGKVHSVRHPAVREGEPLPGEGTCIHYKKSYRWFRFPCCGKLYPCTTCHDLQELDHPGEPAKRMVCGFCCKEQAFSPECMSCRTILNEERTSHWEGGKGCRNAIRMDRHDSRKYANMDKTVSRRKTKSGQKSKTKSGDKNKTN